MGQWPPGVAIEAAGDINREIGIRAIVMRSTICANGDEAFL